VRLKNGLAFLPGHIFARCGGVISKKADALKTRIGITPSR
jgi:hypothetical protein